MKTKKKEKTINILECGHRLNDSIHAFLVLQFTVQRKCLDKLTMCHGTEEQLVGNLTPHKVIRWHAPNTRHVPFTCYRKLRLLNTSYKIYKNPFRSWKISQVYSTPVLWPLPFTTFNWISSSAEYRGTHLITTFNCLSEQLIITCFVD